MTTQSCRKRMSTRITTDGAQQQRTPRPPLQTNCIISHPQSSPVILPQLYFTFLENPHKDKISSCPIKSSSN